MKLLCLIFFIVPIIAQVGGVTFKLTRGTEIVKVNPGDEVVVRLYKKNILNLKIFPNSNLKSSIYKTINFEEGTFIIDNERILLNNLYSISHVISGNRALKNGKKGFFYGLVGGCLLGFSSALLSDDGPLMNPFAFGIILGTVGSVGLGIGGTLKGSFYPNISKEYIISKNKWIIKPQQ